MKINDLINIYFNIYENNLYFLHKPIPEPGVLSTPRLIYVSFGYDLIFGVLVFFSVNFVFIFWFWFWYFFGFCGFFDFSFNTFGRRLGFLEWSCRSSFLVLVFSFLFIGFSFELLKAFGRWFPDTHAGEVIGMLHLGAA
jgi:hypothetical protein